MTSYLVLMIAFALLAVLAPRQKPDRMLWFIAFVVLVLFVGLRHKVGMDWNNYLLMISRVRDVPLTEAFAVAEPAYALLLWLSDWFGAGVYGVNLVGATMLMLGVFRFSARAPLPWMALATAVPILIVVVGMSANRQAMAIGVLMWLAAGWQGYSLRRRLALTLFAAMFHFSAIFFLVFCVLGLRMRASYKLVLAFVMVAAMLVFLQLSGGAEYYDQVYVSGQSEATYSPGAIIHVLLNGLPALLVLLRRPFRQKLFPDALMVQMAWVAMSLVPLALVFSAASGRMTLYLFPVSMYVFSALPAMMRSAVQRAAIRTLLAGLLFMILWYWLAFANSSLAHIPYNNVLWMDSQELHL
jgi:hypothetical protein